MTLTGTVFRAHSPRWSFAPLSGDGAARRGGRFNRRGVPALYVSTTVEGAWREAQQGLAFKMQPMTICAYDVACDGVPDLSDAAGCRARHIEPADLSCPWEDLMTRRIMPPSWTLADRLRADGIAAIIVPSYAPGALPDDRNVVFWRWSDTLPHRVVVIDDERRLPRDARSWESRG